MMKIKVLEKKEDKLKFTIAGVDYTFVNTLRRSAIAEVPVMAIDEVEFNKNDSVLYDEMLAHRLGLVPLVTDLKSYNLPEECTCKGKGCQSCQLKVTLRMKGPCAVYAKDLKFKDKEVRAVYPDMLIVKLMENQQLDFAATAVLGKGKNHAKFSPCLSYFQKYPMITVDQRKFTKNMAELCVEKCPTNVYAVEGNSLKVTDETKCILCGACTDVCKTGLVDVRGADDKFLVHIESWGQLKPAEIVEHAMKLMDDKLEQFRKDVSSVKER